MGTVLEELQQQKTTSYTKVQAKVTEEFKEKLDYICSKTGVNQLDYLGMILEKSEINKVYNKIKKEDKKESNESSKEGESSDYNTVNNSQEYPLI